MARADPIVPFLTLPTWAWAASRCGFDISPALAEAGIDMDLVHLESSTVRASQLSRLMSACVARTQRGHYPFVLGESFAFEYLPDVDTFLATSATLRQALRAFHWVRAFIDPTIRIEVREVGGHASLILHSPANSGLPYFAEATFASTLRFARRLLDDDRAFERLSFRHPAPAWMDAYRQTFPMPLRFSQPHDALEFPAELLDRPLGGGLPALHRQAEYRLERRLQGMALVRGPVAALEHALRESPRLLAAGPDDAARALAWSTRTLQRRLAADGESFASVRERVRQQLAMERLDTGHGDIEALSEDLGFSDRRSFSRAFRRWTGLSPSAFRRRSR